MNSLTLAIADDSSVIRERLAQKLSRMAGIELVWQSCTVPETLEQVRQTPPRVLILDIQMPGGSGIDVLEYLKAAGSETVVIMLTNFPLAPFRKRCMTAGARYFFDKSTEFERIFAVLASMLAGSEESCCAAKKSF